MSAGFSTSSSTGFPFSPSLNTFSSSSCELCPSSASSNFQELLIDELKEKLTSRFQTINGKKRKIFTFTQGELDFITKLLTNPSQRESLTTLDEAQGKNYRLEIIENSKGKQVGIFCYVENTLYMVAHKSIGKGAYKRVNIGLNIDTGQQIAYSVSDPTLGDDEIKIGTTLSRAAGNEDKHVLKTLANFKFTNINGIIKQVIITPYYNQGTLEDFSYKLWKVPFIVQLRIVRKIFMGIAFIHNLGFIQCDIKGENILVNEYKNKKNKIVNKISIADWGLSVETSNFIEKPSARGTEGFFAPEMLELLNVINAAYKTPEDKDFHIHKSAMEITPKIDIYSLGVTIEKIFYDHASKIPYTNLNGVSQQKFWLNLVVKLKEDKPNNRPTALQGVKMLEEQIRLVKNEMKGRASQAASSSSGQ